MTPIIDRGLWGPKLWGDMRVAVTIRVVLPVLALAFGACSPTFNWRDWPLEGTPLRATMPCKPESASREVPLGSGPVVLHMASCETGGTRFALAWADVGAVAQVPQALSAWRAASLQSLRVAAQPGDPALVWPVRLSGIPEATGLRLQGRDHLGQPVQASQVYFAKGALVFQAAVYGQRPDEEASEAFFGGLRLVQP